MPNHNKLTSKSSGKVLLTKCHKCEGITESYTLPKRCSGCEKAFLPMGYLLCKNISEKEFLHLYVSCNDIDEEDLVIGHAVLWS